MREIKYRVWNGMEMVYDITVGKFGVFYVNPEKGDGLNPSDTASLTPNTTKYFDHTPTMEYIGLKDRNGKEIWEGDIVKYGYIGQTSTFTYIGYVYRALDKAMFYVTRKGREQFNECAITNKTINGKGKIFEVIGNVYKNPELLS